MENQYRCTTYKYHIQNLYSVQYKISHIKGFIIRMYYDARMYIAFALHSYNTYITGKRKAMVSI